MSEPLRPAWSRDSVVLQLGEVDTIASITPSWAWGGATGRGVRVAVVDSGVDVTHPALGACVDVDEGIAFSVDEAGAVVSRRGPHDDAFGHGTACAGIIHQLAPEARITSVKVLGNQLTGTSDVFLAGLSWAVEQGFDVINLSLGTRKRDWALAFYEVCDQAYFKGSFLVTAANNINRVSYPSLFASVASVASNLTKDPYRFHHNPEPPTEFLARGIDVEVPWLEHGTITTTGNSFAAPHISGMAALIKSKHPELLPFQLKTVLWATSANVREAAERNPRAGRLSRVLRPGATMGATRASLVLHPDLLRSVLQAPAGEPATPAGSAPTPPGTPTPPGVQAPPPPVHAPPPPGMPTGPGGAQPF